MAKILIIDYEASIRDFLSKALAMAGHEIETALDGQEGLDRMRQARPDLVITDIFMPEKDGLSVIEEARHDFPAVPIFSITAGLGDDCAHAREKGAVRTFVKPLELQELLDAVDQVLREASPNNR